jgi:hypothetical protein
VVLQAVRLPGGSTRTGIVCMITAAALITMNDAVAKLYVYHREAVLVRRRRRFRLPGGGPIGLACLWRCRYRM